MKLGIFVIFCLVLFCWDNVYSHKETLNTYAQQLNFSSWTNVLMISAHPDDIEACAGGLVSLLTAQGTKVSYVIVTNGDKGCGAAFCLNWSSEQIALTRSQEAVAAALVLGVTASQVTLLDYEDAMVTSYPEQQIRENLVTSIRQIKPDVVMTWFPYPNFNLQPSQGWDDLGYHPDHQAVGKLTLDSVFDSGVPLLYPQSGAAWPVSEFYMWEFLTPNYYINLPTAALDAKINAYLAHKTQYPNATVVTEQLTILAERVAQNANATTSFAEGFLSYF